MDEDSILFQAMKNEMNPQVDLAAMRTTDPTGQYPLGVEARIRTPGSAGGVMNPLRMQRQPSDFTGRPSQANDNPAHLGHRGTFENNPQRPSGNVINQYQQQWQNERITNQLNRVNEANRMAAQNELNYYAQNPTMIQRGLHGIREFFNKNRKPTGGWVDKLSEWLD